MEPEKLSDFQILSALEGGEISEKYVVETEEGQLLLTFISSLYSAPQDCYRQNRNLSVLKKVSHPRLLALWKWGKIKEGTYILSELPPGTSLGERLQKGWRPKSRELASILKDLATGLEYLHSRNILYFSLQPRHVFLQRENNQLSAQLATVGVLENLLYENFLKRDTPQAGSLREFQYLSPEQVEGRLLPHRGWDIYALGLIGYEMAAGELPFVDDDFLKTLINKVKNPLPPLREKAKRIPPEMAEIIDGCLAYAPENRWSSAGEIAEKWARILHN